MFTLATIGQILTSVASAGFIFSDIRPRDFPTGRTLDIHVGQLISPRIFLKQPFYNLNYCDSNGVHHYSDEDIQGQENIETIEGVTMFDENLHESFFTVSTPPPCV